MKQIGVPQYGGLILLISHMSPLSTITVIILTIDWVGGGDGEGDRRYKAMPSYTSPRRVRTRAKNENYLRSCGKCLPFYTARSI